MCRVCVQVYNTHKLCLSYNLLSDSVVWQAIHPSVNLHHTHTLCLSKECKFLNIYTASFFISRYLDVGSQACSTSCSVTQFLPMSLLNSYNLHYYKFFLAPFLPEPCWHHHRPLSNPSRLESYLLISFTFLEDADLHI